jgi:hypothetical protein
VGEDPRSYVEFNIAEKLQGSFEEQAGVMSTLVGRPIMTANEGRARFNLPAIPDEEANELVTPLNVTVGGQPSPQSGVAPPGSAGFRPEVKARASEVQARTTERVLHSYFARQAGSVLTAMGVHGVTGPDVLAGNGHATSTLVKASAPAWWNGERWDTELTNELLDLSKSVTAELGSSVASALGYPGTYDPDRTLAWLQAVAASRASAVNAETLARLEQSVSDNPATDENGEPITPTGVFDRLKSFTTPVLATTLLTNWSGFATTEVPRQLGHEDTATKTWRVTSVNPRPEHAALNGQTVGLREPFSNGAQWPGDPTLGADGVSNCRCAVDIAIPATG